MNEIFEFRRFGALAWKWYRENLKLGLIFLAMMGVVTFLALCKFRPFFIEYTQFSDGRELNGFLQQYKGMYVHIFWGLFSLFALVVAFHSLRNFILKERIAVTLLLPASVFEKYLLAFLNSTIVIFIVYFCLFYALASVTNSYKYVGFSKNEVVAENLLSHPLSGRVPGQQIVHPEIGNVLDWAELTSFKPVGFGVEKSDSQSNGMLINLGIIWFLYLISVGMWGSVTFRKHPFILTFLLHQVFMTLWMAFTFWMIVWILQVKPEINYNVLNFYTPSRPSFSPSGWWLLLLYIFPLGYQFVIWMKLKTKQI